MMPGRAEQRGRTAGLAVAVVLAAAVAACGDHAAATGAAAHGGRRFTATAADGGRLTVPGTRPAVIDFVSAGCVTGLAALAQAKAADPGADYVAVDIGPGATGPQLHAILAATGATGLAAATDPNGSVMTAYRVLAVGTTIVQAPTGAIIYTGIGPSSSQITAAVAAAAHR
jgi:hypothetical protein